MARIDHELTSKLWNVTYEEHANAMKHMTVINYYDKGIRCMNQHIKSICKDKTYGQLVASGEDKLIDEINKTIKFYKTRLKEQ